MALPRSVTEMAVNGYKARRVESNLFRGFSFTQPDFSLPERDIDESDHYWNNPEADGESEGSSVLFEDDRYSTNTSMDPPLETVTEQKKKRPPRKKKKKMVEIDSVLSNNELKGKEEANGAQQLDKHENPPPRSATPEDTPLARMLKKQETNVDEETVVAKKPQLSTSGLSDTKTAKAKPLGLPSRSVSITSAWTTFPTKKLSLTSITSIASKPTPWSPAAKAKADCVNPGLNNGPTWISMKSNSVKPVTKAVSHNSTNNAGYTRSNNGSQNLRSAPQAALKSVVSFSQEEGLWPTLGGGKLSTSDKTVAQSSSVWGSKGSTWKK